MCVHVVNFSPCFLRKVMQYETWNYTFNQNKACDYAGGIYYIVRGCKLVYQ